MKTTKPLKVLISGAGIAGPSLAFFLAKLGSSVTVLEKSPTLTTQGQNVDITGSAIKVIRKMGLYDEIRSHHTTEKGTQFIDPEGKPFARFPVKEGKTMSPTSEFEILRGDLAKVFYEATKALPGVDYRWGTTIAEIIRNDESTVQVLLSDGETHSYDLLVAADGQWSRTRKMTFPAETITTVPKGMYAIYWTAKKTERDNDWWNIYQALPSKVLTTRPDPYGSIRACFTLMPCNPSQAEEWAQAARGSRETKRALVLREFKGTGWASDRLLNDLDLAPDFYFQAVEQIKLSRWSFNRTVCLGDAGYAPTPLTGAGTSLAILGAYVLAGELSSLPPGSPIHQALTGYEAKFKPHVEETQSIPSFVPSIAHPGTPFKRGVFAWGIWTVSKLVQTVLAVPWLADKFAGDPEQEDFKLPFYPRLERDVADGVETKMG
jgi:2-polyprenyl-6-methoxyphenol hydroxylase-like FAD-dependent oxidoreductase